MKRRRVAAAVAGALAAGVIPQPSGPTPVSADYTPHVMLIVEENREYSSVIGAAPAPYVNQLAALHGVARESFGQSHPSLPNYLTLLSGSTQGVTDDGTGYRFTSTTLVDQLHDRGIGWRAYMEGMPNSCYSGVSGNGYAKKHDPFMYFTSITQDPAACAGVVPYSQLSSDLRAGTAPPFLWVTPDLCHDGHDCSTSTIDSWLASMLPAVLSSSWFAQDGIVIITWDEGSSGAGCCSGAHGGHVATVVVSSRLSTPSSSSAAVDHAGVLRTLELLYALPYLGDAGCSCSGDLMALVGPAPVPVSGWLTVPHLR